MRATFRAHRRSGNRVYYPHLARNTLQEFRRGRQERYTVRGATVADFQPGFQARAVFDVSAVERDTPKRGSANAISKGVPPA